MLWKQFHRVMQNETVKFINIPSDKCINTIQKSLRWVSQIVFYSSVNSDLLYTNKYVIIFYNIAYKNKLYMMGMTKII